LSYIGQLLCFGYLNQISTQERYETLDYTVNSTANLLEVAYNDPLWNPAPEVIEKLSKGVLDMPEIIAVNVYDDSDFIVGYKKNHIDSNLVKEEILKPFKISNNNTLLHKKTVNIKNDSGDVGKFDLFYTDIFIINSNKQANIVMGTCLILLVLIVTLANNIAMKKLVILPVTELSDKTWQIADSKDYSIKVEKSGKDEISRLYAGFNNMLVQIRKKEIQREELFTTLHKRDENYHLMFKKLEQAVINSDYSRFKEIDSDLHGLVTSFNTFLETLRVYDLKTKEEDFLKTGQTTLSDAVRGQLKVADLCRNAIVHLSEYLNAQIGAVYVKNSEHDYFEFSAGYAFKKQKDFHKTFKIGEGFAGQVALGKKPLIITEIPDTYVKITSSLGRSIPKNILLFPLIYEEDVKGIVELGSTTTFTKIMIDFTEIAGNIIAVAITTALANENMKKHIQPLENS